MWKKDMSKETQKIKIMIKNVVLWRYNINRYWLNIGYNISSSSQKSLRVFSQSLSHGQDDSQSQILSEINQVLIQISLFLDIGLNKAKEPSLPYYLFIVVSWIDRFKDISVKWNEISLVQVLDSSCCLYFWRR